MQTNPRRRMLLKGAMIAGSAAGAAMLLPRTALAVWPRAAFDAGDVGAALRALTGTDHVASSGRIQVAVPHIAETRRRSP